MFTSAYGCPPKPTYANKVCMCVCICVYARRERKYLILIRYDANSEVIYSNVEKIYIIKGYLLKLYKSLACDTTRHNTIMP